MTALAQSLSTLDRRPLPAIRRLSPQRVEDHLRLALKFCSKHVRGIKGRVKDSEEYSEALYGLWEACESYSVDCGPFSTYAYKCMGNRLKQLFRYRARKCRTADVIKDAILEAVPSPEPHVRDEIAFDHDLSRLLAPCEGESSQDKMCRLFLAEHYLHGKSWAEIGRERGLTRAFVSQCGKRAIQRIRERHKIRI